MEGQRISGYYRDNALISAITDSISNKIAQDSVCAIGAGQPGVLYSRKCATNHRAAGTAQLKAKSLELARRWDFCVPESRVSH